MQAPLPTPEKVNLKRFMGTWFVHGYTPIIVDKHAHNAVEHYFLNDRGRIETTYQFRKGSYDGELKTYTPTGFVSDSESQARWGMQFLWPFKADYVIVYLSDDYKQTIIGHPNRKYAWIMQRDPKISSENYQALLDRLDKLGYDTDRIQKVPHDWANDSERLKTIESVGDDQPLSDAMEP